MEYFTNAPLKYLKNIQYDSLNDAEQGEKVCGMRKFISEDLFQKIFKQCYITAHRINIWNLQAFFLNFGAHPKENEYPNLDWM